VVEEEEEEGEVTAPHKDNHSIKTLTHDDGQ
jgi:hypothetical protein